LHIKLSLDEDTGYAFDLFLLHHSYTPNTMNEPKIDCRKANDWFINEYEKEIKDSHYTKWYYKKNKNFVHTHIYHFLFDDLLVHFRTDPGLIKVLVSNPNSIFVIEDAENIIIDRNRNGHSPVSALLNLADGLLSDCLNIQIICSFNTDLSRMDNALMRKGRLIAKYEFKELEIGKAQALSDKLGFHSTIDAPMVLTDIYNQHEASFSNTVLRKAVGFNS
jgi:hypothetical protein